MATVDVSSTTVTSLNVVFTEAMAAQSAIDDGKIWDAVSLVDVAKGPVPMDTVQFAYDCGTQTLTLSFDESLPAATYGLQLNGSLLTDADGNALRGGSSGLAFQLPVFAAAEMIQTDGADIHVNSFSVPMLEDWNGDGLTDLIVGEKSATGEGKVRVYLNSGTNPAPVYAAFSYAQSGAADLAVSGSGCLGVFPRVFDWNQDGLKDLVLGLADGTVHVALNKNTNTDPNFAAPEPVQVGQPGNKADVDVGVRATLAIVDWNNDGRYDLVLGGLDGTVRVLLNEADSGSPDFRSETIVLDGGAGQGVPTGRASVDVADLNGDGRKDLVVGNTEGQLLFYPNVGTDAAPEFVGNDVIEAGGSEVDLEGEPRSRPFVGDANGDGIADILVGAADGLVRQYIATSAPVVADGPGNNEGEPGETYTHTFRVIPPWQCPTHKHDVDNDGRIMVLDVLALVNHIVDNGTHKLPDSPDPPNAPPPYLDCNGDGNVTTLDILQLVTDLNALGPRALAEGEGAWDMLAESSPIAEGESTQQSSHANPGDKHDQQPQPQPMSQPQKADRDVRGETLHASTEEEFTADTLDLEEALSEIVSSFA